MTEAEIIELQNLVTTFGIEEGGFLRARPGELAALLAAQIKSILEDRYVTEPDEILLRNLQELFDLGYEEYVGLL